MRTYLLKRLLLVPPTMFGITLITFFIIQLAPGDPANMKVSPGVGGEQSSDQSVSREIYEKTLEQFDLDKPKLMQYARWLGRLMGIKVEVTGAKHLYKDEVETYLLDQFRKGNQDTIAAMGERLVEQVYDERSDPILIELAREADLVDRKQGQSMLDEAREQTVPVAEVLGRSIGAAELAQLQESLGPRLDQEAKRQLEDWAKGQAKAERFRYAEEVNAIRQSYVTEYGKEFEKEFWYSGLSLNRTQSGGWYPMDFGKSFQDDRQVWEHLIDKLPISIELSLLSIFVAYIVAIPLGIHSSTHQGTFGDAFATTVLFILYSLPSFWVAIMMLLLISQGSTFEIVRSVGFPVEGLHGDLGPNPGFFAWLFDHLHHLVMPIVCLTYGSFAYISRQMRAGMLDVIRQDYIRTARAKGLSERVVIFKHALRNSLIPIITIVAFILPALVGGSVIIETIFNIDGIGKASFTAILTRDYPFIMAVFTLSAFLTLIGILLSDLLYAVVNPQISFEG
jgi:peptide/nickel transport system permease protein